MLLFSHTHLDRYTGLHPRFVTLAHWLEHTDLDALAAGIYILEGDDCTVTLAEGDLQPAASRPFEYHERMIDWHIPLRGSERIDIARLESCSASQQFTDAEDIGFLETEVSGHSTIIAHPGDIVVVYPGEAHKPCCLPNSDADPQYRKLVAKIRY